MSQAVPISTRPEHRFARIADDAERLVGNRTDEEARQLAAGHRDSTSSARDEAIFEAGRERQRGYQNQSGNLRTAKARSRDRSR